MFVLVSPPHHPPGKARRSPCCTLPVAARAGSAGDTANPCAGWLPDTAWRMLCKLAAAVPAFADLPASLVAEEAAWRAVYDSPTPHTAPLPGEWGQLSAFRQLLLLRCAPRAWV